MTLLQLLYHDIVYHPCHLQFLLYYPNSIFLFSFARLLSSHWKRLATPRVFTSSLSHAIFAFVKCILVVYYFSNDHVTFLLISIIIFSYMDHNKGDDLFIYLNIVVINRV